MAFAPKEFAYIKGKASWIYTKNLSDFGDWRITLHIDNNELNKILDLQARGVKNQIKKDDNGYYVRFRRSPEIEMKDKITGLPKKIGMRPPEVIMADGTPFDGIIGSGSDVEVKLEVYEHNTPNGGKSRAARLLGIRIDNLVPFERQKDFDDEQKRATAGLVPEVKQTPW
jgi:hypothetical protein